MAAFSDEHRTARKHAAVITAYKDYGSLHRLLDDLQKIGFGVYIHIDVKSSYSQIEIDELKSRADFVIQNRRIRWGSYEHLRAVVDLCEVALKSHWDYVHVLSGQDMLLKSREDIDRDCDGTIYMTVTDSGDLSAKLKQRFEVHHLFDATEVSSGWKWLFEHLWNWQRKLGIYRKKIGPFNQLYKGLIWASMPGDICRSLLKDARNSGFLRGLRTVAVPEEFFWQTLVMNSPFKTRVIRESRRFMKWPPGEARSPDTLDVSDKENILESSAFFARKIDSVISRDLIEELRLANLY